MTEVSNCSSIAANTEELPNMPKTKPLDIRGASLSKTEVVLDFRHLQNWVATGQKF